MGKLHRLFRKIEHKTLTDDEGNSIDIVFRSLTNIEETDLQEEARTARDQARVRYDTEDARGGFRLIRRAQTKEALIRDIVALDRRVATDLTDLAPNAGGDLTEEARKAAEKEALDRADASRREQLEGVPFEGLVEMAVDRDIAGAIATAANARLLDLSMCRMILDPETKEPMLSMDPQSEEYIGNLDTQTRLILTQFWNALQMERGSRMLRLVAENPTLSSRGGSERNSGSSHGEIATTSSISPVI